MADFKDQNLVYPTTIGNGDDSLYLNFTCYDYKAEIPGVSERLPFRSFGGELGKVFGNLGETLTNVNRFGNDPGFAIPPEDKRTKGKASVVRELGELRENRKNPKGRIGTVSLYLPPKLESKYSADWQKMQFGALGAGFSNTNGFNLGGAIGAAAATGGSYLLELAKSFLQNTPQVENLSLNGLVGATLGISFNDNTIQTFNKMNPRTFDFEYIMIAKSLTEVVYIKEIIRQFKLSMHPSAGSNATGIFLEYPYIWRITPGGYKNSRSDVFTGLESENFLDFLPKTDLCALVDMKVDYTPDNNISLNTAGFVQAVRLSLSFIELITLTREDIDKSNY